MDPQVTWQNLHEAFRERNWDEARELARSLLDWLQRGGFSPSVQGIPSTDPDLHRQAAQAFCRRVLREATAY